MRTYQHQPSGTVDRARDLRRHATDAEKRLWSGLRQTFPALRFRRQVPVGPYFVDFLTLRAGLVIEVDGGQHDDASAYDARRTVTLNEHGFRVERFWNDDVLTNLNGVLQHLAVVISTDQDAGAGMRFTLTLPPLCGSLPLPPGEGMELREGGSV